MAIILMVDDDMLSVQSIKDNLSFYHKVDLERNLDEAVKLLTTKKYDLVILDLFMPHRSRYTSAQTLAGRETGYVLLREIRSGKAGFKTPKEVPVLVLTHIRDEQLKRKVLEEGPVEFLHKPQPLSRIVESVDRMLALGFKGGETGNLTSKGDSSDD